MPVEYPVAIVTVEDGAGAGADLWSVLSAGRLSGVHLRPLADATGQFSALVDQLAPRTDVPGPAWLLQARRNATARDALLQEVGALSADQVAVLAGTKASNRRATASRWLRDGNIFAVAHRGARLFLGFQFDPETGKPKPVVRTVLRTLPEQLAHGGWQLALWWVTPTAWLDWRRPLDVMDDDPESVSAAARYERDEWSAAGAGLSRPTQGTPTQASANDPQSPSAAAEHPIATT